MEEEDMEIMGEEEEEEEEEMEVYEVVEVDFDYEFDAATFFDFTRPESEAEARTIQAWFLSAPSYPPSPFVAKLFPMEGLNSHNVDVSPKSKYGEGISLVYDDADIDQTTEYCDQDQACRAEERSQALLRNIKGGTIPNSQNQAGVFGGPSGLSFFNHLAHDMKKTKSKSLAKPCIPRSSTLMKPTASQLAKQNQRRQVCDSRLQINEGNSSAHCGIESQASKRQKLDGGLLHRIDDMKQPINLIHKMPKKDGTVQGMISQSKPRITIPREPDLETAHRAERIRSTSIKEVENPTSRTSRFKARPLNRKILEAPARQIPKRSTPHMPDFHAFRLKTTERANQHASSATTTSLCHQSEKVSSKASAPSIVETGGKDGKRFDSVDASKFAQRELTHSFKARPLDRKILTSKGDLGVFRNSKRDVTVPKEFEFQTAKRNQQNPPIDLFNKLSLAGETQPKSCAQLQFPRTCIPSKGSKENRWESCQQDLNMKHQAREAQVSHTGKWILNVANGGGNGEIGVGNGKSRAFGGWKQ